jgi:GRB2-associated-binding protein 1
VLRHSGELPGQYFLAYYTDKSRRKMKGRIDLDQCEQVKFIILILIFL